MKKIICFHHSDLDGFGVKLLTMMYAKKLGVECETHKCDYTYVNQLVKNTLENNQFCDVQEIIMADISPSENGEDGVAILDYWYQNGVPVRLRDHHKTAEWLNQYPWAKVTERIDGVERCGTYLLAMEPDFQDVLSQEIIRVFVQEVDSWDTWKWKKQDDLLAKDLNSVFQILGEDDFTKYMLDVFDDVDIVSSHVEVTEEMLFTPYSRTLIEAHDRQVRKAADKCVKDMWLMDLKVPRKSNSYKTAVIFASQDLSDIADIVLSEHPEIDIVMIFSFPKTISYRTQKRLDIPLGDIAKFITGSGGGHPQAAGSTISQKQFYKIFKKTLENLSGNMKGLEFNSLRVKE